MGFVVQSLLLLLSFVLLFVFNEAKLNNLTPQLIGLLVFIVLILSASKKREFSISGPLGVFALNTVIFLVIFSTGGISSSFFFVLYFLVFGIAFVFEPHLAFIFAAGALIVFLPDAFKGSVIENIVKLGSLFIISPLAYFFGKMFRKQDQADDQVVAVKERAKEAADTISKDVEEVLKEPGIPAEDVSKLNEVLEETEDLRAETKE